jgi:hypothetical protein
LVRGFRAAGVVGAPTLMPREQGALPLKLAIGKDLSFKFLVVHACSGAPASASRSS